MGYAILYMALAIVLWVITGKLRQSIGELLQSPVLWVLAIGLFMVYGLSQVTN